MYDAYRLGASLYIPADHPQLEATLSGRKYPAVRSLIACTEDAVLPDRLEYALAQLREALGQLPARGVGPMRFVRCRNPQTLSHILSLPGIERIDGFVLPKFDFDNLAEYTRLLGNTRFYVMPTLETLGVFDPAWQRELLQALQPSPLKVLALRIGGNDLLKFLGLRRLRGVTTYETPVGALIAQLVLTFRPHGFQLTAPVYDYFDDTPTLVREIAQDLRMGLIGKTAIHPRQAKVIERGLRVSQQDMSAARKIMGPGGQHAAVFQHEGGMLETAVHSEWARQTLAKAASGEA